MAKTKVYKIGDEVTSFLLLSSGKRNKVKGKIKSVKNHYGRNTYVITGGVAEDFSTRTILKK